MKKGLILALMVLITMVGVPSVQAISSTITETYYFTSQHCTGGCGPFPDGLSYGTVTLDQYGTGPGAYTNVTVHLLGNLEFVSTGAGSFMDFLFNPTGVTAGDITITQNATWTWAVGTGSPTFNTGGTGDFTFGITGRPDQSTGGAGAFDGNIMFSVADATIADLANANTDGNIFVADIYNPDWTTQEAPNGVTGLVDSTGTTVPEPLTLLLLGCGLIGLWAAKKNFDK